VAFLIFFFFFFFFFFFLFFFLSSKDIVDASGWAEQPVKPWIPRVALIESAEIPFLYDAEEDDIRFVGSLAKQFVKPLSLDVFEIMIAHLEHLTGSKEDLTEVIPLAKAKAELSFLAGNATLVAVYGYWYLKRLRLDRALVPENELPPAVDDLNPFKNFRRRLDTPIARRRKLREDRAEYGSGERMKTELMKAAALVALVRDRELAKKDLVVGEEDWFDVEAFQAKKPKVEQEDFHYRLRSGLWGGRSLSFDSEADVYEFRHVFPDPNCLEVDEEECTEEPLPLEMRYLAFVKFVSIPGVTSFWGIPRVSRRGQVVYDPLTLQDVELLLERDPVRPENVKRWRLKRIAGAIRALRALRDGCGEEDDSGREDEAVQLARDLGWWPLDEPMVL
jgi:hypothetical protein